MNENENNKNREYPAVDKRIKETYIKESTAQKTSSYDMYKRFYRWAMDRIDKNGVIAFITNNSFIDGRDSDGFRKVISNEFDYAYIIDLGGNIRELSGKDGIFLNEKHTIFGVSAMVGISIMWLIKDDSAEHKQCMIYYLHPTDIRAIRDEKIEYLLSHKIPQIPFEHIIPDSQNNWINLVENNWDDMIPVVERKSKNKANPNSIFSLFSTGIMAGRDEWIVSHSIDDVDTKMKFFIDVYSKTDNVLDTTIKWSRNLKRRHSKSLVEEFDSKRARQFFYRPYSEFFLYHSDLFVDESGFMFSIFSGLNASICVSGIGGKKPFQSLITNGITCYDYLEKTQCLPLYRYDRDGTRHDNITDWALNEFRQHYQDESIGKEDIFHYVYGVLHDPLYRKKYEINLKRSLPRLPWQADFWQWANWGRELMDLHLGFETAEPWPLEIVETKDDSPEPLPPKAKLKADKLEGTIILTDQLRLTGVPASAWDYKLGNRSALEWILDQYREKKPKDPTIAKLFNSYRFADYQDKVIELLRRVTTVSVRTMEIVQEMEKTLCKSNS